MYTCVVYECPVCGSAELTVQPYETWPPPEHVALSPPYEDLLARASYEVCPNCGFEFGNDDNPGTAPPSSSEEYLADWIADGRPRFAAQRLNRRLFQPLECAAHSHDGRRA